MVKKIHTEYPLQVYDWIISNAKTVIASMGCQKATALAENNTPIEAWFTDEIPLSNEPGIYHGLPGLILKVETAGGVISATKVSFIEKAEMKQWEDSRLVKEENLLETFKQVVEENRPKPVVNDN